MKKGLIKESRRKKNGPLGLEREEGPRGPGHGEGLAEAREVGAGVWVPLLLLFVAEGEVVEALLEVAVALGPRAGALSLFLYIVRHGALYYALGKWLLEWNRQLFDADVGPSPENVTE